MNTPPPTPPISCIAIDDEPMALLVIEQFCHRLGGLALTTYSEPHVGLKAICREHPRLVFLDIQMNSLSGLDIARNALPADTCFIFTTAHARYALEGFNLDAVDFLHKPFSYERFAMAVSRALRRIGAAAPRPVAGTIVVKQDYTNITLNITQITHIEALGNYARIHLTAVADGATRSVLTRASLKRILQLLANAGEAEGFLRIHRSFLVATHWITGYTRTHVWLHGLPAPLPIGQQYAPLALQVLAARAGSP